VIALGSVAAFTPQSKGDKPRVSAGNGTLIIGSYPKQFWIIDEATRRSSYHPVPVRHPTPHQRCRATETLLPIRAAMESGGPRPRRAQDDPRLLRIGAMISVPLPALTRGLSPLTGCEPRPRSQRDHNWPRSHEDTKQGSHGNPYGKDQIDLPPSFWAAAHLLVQSGA